MRRLAVEMPKEAADREEHHRFAAADSGASTMY